MAEPVEKSLSFWLGELGIPQPIAFAPYNQVFQQLLDPSSLLAANQNGINVILARPVDWQQAQVNAGSGADAGTDIERNTRDFARAVSGAAARSAAIHFVFLCPASPDSAVDPALKQMEELIVSELRATPRVHVVTSQALAATYPVAEYYDAQADKLAHMPYTPLFFTALGSMIARKIHALKNSGYKVIVLDGDQTLWDGVCGEDGPSGIRIGAERKALQEFMVEQHNAGTLLSLCSANNEEDVAEVFSCHPEMPLKREHFAASRINWRPKSENIKALAKELQLGLDSFIFIDDDVVACAEVQTHCPEVLTLQLPREVDAIPRFLRHLWVFDRLTITEEAGQRTVLYAQHAQRERIRQASPTLQDFLTSLDLKIQIMPLAAEHLARVVELTQRTNQFNLTTIRRSEAEIQARCQGKTQCLV
ncbi:MAG: HAD-IIIC family phosphatase, partial [Pyrinomonadaceae bacterium]